MTYIYNNKCDTGRASEMDVLELLCVGYLRYHLRKIAVKDLASIVSRYLYQRHCLQFIHSEKYSHLYRDDASQELICQFYHQVSPVNRFSSVIFLPCISHLHPTMTTVFKNVVTLSVRMKQLDDKCSWCPSKCKNYDFSIIILTIPKKIKSKTNDETKLLAPNEIINHMTQVARGCSKSSYTCCYCNKDTDCVMYKYLVRKNTEYAKFIVWMFGKRDNKFDSWYYGPKEYPAPTTNSYLLVKTGDIKFVTKDKLCITVDFDAGVAYGQKYDHVSDRHRNIIDTDNVMGDSFEDGKVRLDFNNFYHFFMIQAESGGCSFHNHDDGDMDKKGLIFEIHLDKCRHV